MIVLMICTVVLLLILHVFVCTRFLDETPHHSKLIFVTLVAYVMGSVSLVWMLIWEGLK